MDCTKLLQDFIVNYIKVIKVFCWKIYHFDTIIPAIINMIDIHLGWPLTDLWTLCTCRTIVLQIRKEFKGINWFICLNSVLICRTIVRHVHKVHKFKRINQFIPLNSVLICRTIVRHVHKVHKSVSGHPRWISIILIIAELNHVLCTIIIIRWCKMLFIK